jgi:formylglycine-generating enzyme
MNDSRSATIVGMVVGQRLRGGKWPLLMALVASVDAAGACSTNSAVEGGAQRNERCSSGMAPCSNDASVDSGGSGGTVHGNDATVGGGGSTSGAAGSTGGIASTGRDASTDASNANGGSSISDASVSVGGDGGQGARDGGTAPKRPPPSCDGLPATCGASGSEDCCASPVVRGGRYDVLSNCPPSVSDFRLDKYEITVGRFRKFVDAYSQGVIPAGAGKNPNNPDDPGWDPSWNADLPADAAALEASLDCDYVSPTYQTAFSTWDGGSDNQPVNCITWYEAFAFCIWDGGRLPTKNEWTYAAAGGAEDRYYPWGKATQFPDPTLAVYSCNYNGTGVNSCTGVTNIAPVGSVPAGNGKYGQSDLAGNMEEWNLDFFPNPATILPFPCRDCATFEPASGRVIRDSDFRTTDLKYNRWEFPEPPSRRSWTRGARCARSADIDRHPGGSGSDVVSGAGGSAGTGGNQCVLDAGSCLGFDYRCLEGSECCAGNCTALSSRDDTLAPKFCRPPGCRYLGESCTTNLDCCHGQSGYCINSMCTLFGE